MLKIIAKTVEYGRKLIHPYCNTRSREGGGLYW